MPDGRIQGGGLSGPRRPRYQDDAVPELQQFFNGHRLCLVEPKGVQAENRPTRIEDSNDDFLPLGNRQRRHPKIDGDGVHDDAGTPVLGPKPVGDVQRCYDLQTRNQWEPCRSRDLHDLPQHAIDAVADGDTTLLRLDVDVAGPR